MLGLAEWACAFQLTWPQVTLPVQWYFPHSGTSQSFAQVIDHNLPQHESLASF